MALNNKHKPELDMNFLCNDRFPNSNFGKPKRLLVISFSGGRTSAYMTWLLLNRYKGIRDIVVVFANTGKEREETLKFVHDCDEYFGFCTVWIEAVVIHHKGIGTSYKHVTYETASRKGEPFEEVIKKFGVPNIENPHCSREMKEVAIRKLIRSYHFGYDYDIAVGIRGDESKRLKKKDNIIYPLAHESYTTKLQVRQFWAAQEFDLQLKSYEGNCDNCFKKSKRRLLTLLVDRPESADWWNDMQIKYGGGYYFYRDNTSMDELLEDSKLPFNRATDDYTLEQLIHSDPDMDYTNGCEESCEAF